MNRNSEVGWRSSGGLGTIAWLLVLIGLGTMGCSRRSTELDLLRGRIVQLSGGEAQWSTQFEFGAGPALLGLTRVGLALADIDREARLAVSSLGSVEVGVYRRSAADGRFDRAEVLKATALLPGWDRVVAVSNDEEVVTVYARTSGSDNVDVCVCVLNRDELVLVSGRGDPRPLIELARAEGHIDRLLPRGGAADRWSVR